MRQKRLYDLKIHQRLFDVGDLVYKRNTSLKKGEMKKLNPLYAGPFVVVKVLSPALYKVRDQKKSQVLHHDKLKTCEDRGVPLWATRLREKLLKAEKEGTHGERGLEAEKDDDVALQDLDAEEGGQGPGNDVVLQDLDAEEVDQGPDDGVARRDLDETLPYGFATEEEAVQSIGQLFDHEEDIVSQEAVDLQTKTAKKHVYAQYDKSAESDDKPAGAADLQTKTAKKHVYARYDDKPAESDESPVTRSGRTSKRPEKWGYSHTQN